MIQIVSDEDQACLAGFVGLPQPVKIMRDSFAHALHDLAHRLVAGGHEPLGAIDGLLGDQLLHAGQKRVGVHAAECDHGGVEMIVGMLMGLPGGVMGIVMRGDALDTILGGGIQAGQDFGVCFAVGHEQGLDPCRQARAEPGLDRLSFVVGKLVGLGHDRQIGGRDLVVQQLFQRRVMIQRLVRLAGHIHRVGVMGPGAGGDRRAIEHGDHRIDRAMPLDLGPVERLNQRLGQGQAAGFDDDMIDGVAFFDQFFHHRYELFLDRAADTAVGQLEDAVLGFSRLIITGQRTAAQQFGIDIHLAELVHDHSDALVGRVLDEIG